MTVVLAIFLCLAGVYIVVLQAQLKKTENYLLQCLRHIEAMHKLDTMFKPIFEEDKS